MKNEGLNLDGHPIVIVHKTGPRLSLIVAKGSIKLYYIKKLGKFVAGEVDVYLSGRPLVEGKHFYFNEGTLALLL